MANKAYNRGSAFERRIKRELEDAGYYVTKSGGSKGPVDLSVVDCNGHPYFIQCKKDGRISKANWNKLRELGQNFKTTTLLISKPKRNEPVRFEYINFATAKALPYLVLGWAPDGRRRRVICVVRSLAAKSNAL